MWLLAEISFWSVGAHTHTHTHTHTIKMVLLNHMLPDGIARVRKCYLLIYLPPCVVVVRICGLREERERRRGREERGREREERENTEDYTLSVHL